MERFKFSTNTKELMNKKKKKNVKIFPIFRYILKNLDLKKKKEHNRT